MSLLATLVKRSCATVEVEVIGWRKVSLKPKMAVPLSSPRMVVPISTRAKNA